MRDSRDSKDVRDVRDSNAGLDRRDYHMDRDSERMRNTDAGHHNDGRDVYTQKRSRSPAQSSSRELLENDRQGSGRGNSPVPKRARSKSPTPPPPMASAPQLNYWPCERETHIVYLSNLPPELSVSEIQSLLLPTRVHKIHIRFSRSRGTQYCFCETSSVQEAVEAANRVRGTVLKDNRAVEAGHAELIDEGSGQSLVPTMIAPVGAGTNTVAPVGFPAGNTLVAGFQHHLMSAGPGGHGVMQPTLLNSVPRFQGPIPMSAVTVQSNMNSIIAAATAAANMGNPQPHPISYTNVTPQQYMSLTHPGPLVASSPVLGRRTDDPRILHDTLESRLRPTSADIFYRSNSTESSRPSSRNGETFSNAAGTVDAYYRNDARLVAPTQYLPVGAIGRQPNNLSSPILGTREMIPPAARGVAAAVFSQPSAFGSTSDTYRQPQPPVPHDRDLAYNNYGPPSVQPPPALQLPRIDNEPIRGPPPPLPNYRRDDVYRR